MHYILLVLFAVALPANAAFILTLDQPTISGLPGTHVILSGSLLNENVFGEDVMSIANTNLTGSGAGLVQVLAPGFMAFGDTYTGNIVEVVLLNVAAGSYPATLAFTFDTVNGRAATTNAAGFSADVLPVAEIPEPGTLSLVLAGLLLAGVFARRRNPA